MRTPLALLLGLALITAPGAAAQTAECPPYRGVTCDGWVTDDAGVLVSDETVEAAAGRLVAAHGHEIAVVIVSSTGSIPPDEFAAGIGNTWGVGDAAADDGIVVLVALAERRTEIVTGSGLRIAGLDSVASAGNSYFADGDFDGGVVAILSRLDLALQGGGVTPPVDGDPDSGGFVGTAARVIAGLAMVGAGWAVIGRSRRKHREQVERRRGAVVDDVLDRLEPSGDELPSLAGYALDPPASPEVSTRDAMAALVAVGGGRAPEATAAATALWGAGVIEVVDRDRLVAEAQEPLELRVSQERDMLEEAVQQASRDAVAVDLAAEDEFRVRMRELENLVGALRPHRIASARRRTAESLADSLVETAVGWVGITDLGARMLRAATALDPDASLSDSITELEAARAVATEKTERLETLYRRLPASTARPAVAAALADLDDDVDEAVRRYETLRTHLEEEGDVLARDGLDIPAITALLLMNRDEDHVKDFLRTYRARRTGGADPAEAVEYALAGLRDPDEIRRIRQEAGRLGLPVSITAALLRRRDDGLEVYSRILGELAGHGVAGETRRTIAGVLAMSLEPGRAVARWKEALEALEALGLEGSYAEVAAAFGASDGRGPRAFALSYAAQREALAVSTIDDADRFAPELAHEGTSRQTDSWTGQPIPTDYGAFDPFTLFFYHWVITRGSAGSRGWEAIHRDRSWSGDRSSWWGGFGGGGGFGTTTSTSGGSSWGSSGGGSFGGFSGGGGFSSGGGGGSSGGSGW
ncbi:MAG TPA: TPM domain-containing protein [Acidimicrobiia bacterium]|nr:TPM domain-containing protein [Acidimicrobiia bacterium]